MTKITLDDEKLKEAYEIAERENRTLLGVIYNNYIISYFSKEKTLNPRDVYANRSLILKMIALDKKLNPGKVDIMYLQYGPSTSFKGKLGESEVMIFKKVL